MKPATMHRALESLNWQGHVELPDNDLTWLAESLANVLNANDDARMCGVCNEFKDITVETKIGRICEECIEDASDIAEAQREELEE